MDWGDISELCGQELEAKRALLPPLTSFFPNPERLADTLLTLESETDQAVHAAVNQFAESRTWPQLADKQETLLCFRLEFAAQIADLLFQQPAPWTDSPDSQHDEERLGWLMLFAWHQVGFQWLYETLARMLGDKSGSVERKNSDE